MFELIIGLIWLEFLGFKDDDEDEDEDKSLII
jgi:hypothetical protein